MKALNSSYLKTGPQIHTHRDTQKDMELPASCGLRRNERTRPASRCVQRSASRNAFRAPAGQTLPTPCRPVYLLSFEGGLLFQTTRLPIGRGVLTLLVADSRLDEGVRVVLALRSLARASRRSEGGSAHILTSGHVSNGDRAESETGRVRRPLLSDWLKGHHAYVRLRPRARLLVST